MEDKGLIVPDKIEGNIRIASFDIARINFAHYIEDFPKQIIDNLKSRYSSLPPKLQRRVQGPMNDKIEEILEEIYKNGERVHMGVYDLRSENSDRFDMTIRRNLLSHLQKFKRLWDSCDIVVIEQQYFRTFPRGRRRSGTEANVDAIKIAEATCIWFLTTYDNKDVTYFGSQFKTQILGAPPKLNDSERKKWAISKNLEIHKLRGDKQVQDLYELKERIKRKRMNSEEKIRSFTDDLKNYSEDIKRLADQTVRYRQKFDDFSDACLQLQAFKFRKMITNF